MDKVTNPVRLVISNVYVPTSRCPGGHIVEHAGFEPASWLFPMGVKANRNQNVPLGGTVSGVSP